MDLEDFQLGPAYLPGALPPGQQLTLPSVAQVTADILNAWGGRQVGGPKAPGSGDGPVAIQSQAPLPLQGLYALGSAGLSGSTLDNPAGYYDDSTPDSSAFPAPSSNPNLVLTANRLTPPGPGPLTPYGPDNPAPIALTPTGQGAGPPPAPNPASGGAASQPGPGWRTPTPDLPSPQAQAAANATMLGQGLPDASYTNPTLDALSNTAQGRAVSPGETQPDLSGRLPTESPEQYRQRRLYNADLQALRDPWVKAYLDTMAFSEAYGYGAPLAYDSLYRDQPLGRRMTFSDFGQFPKGISVAGRYQFEHHTYDGLTKELGVSDMMPGTQDVMAVQLMREHGVLQRLLSDDFVGAVANSDPWRSTPQLVNGQWALRPVGSKRFAPFDELQKYYQGQLSVYASQH